MKIQDMLLALAMVLSLAGCGNQGTSPGVMIVGGLVSRAAGAGGGASADPRQALTREMIESAGQPLLLVVIPARDAAATLTVAGRNGDKETWLSEGGQSITLRGGQIIATKALGDDLMGLNSPGGLAAVRVGQTIRRDYEFLNGVDRIAHFTMTCTSRAAGSETLNLFGRAYPTRKVVETCVEGEVSISNTYWFDPNGAMRQSDQWVSFGVGMVSLARL